MKKQEIINVLLNVLSTHETWADQGQVLIDGINLDRLIEPVKLNECDFSIWNTTNKNNIVAFSWYDELVKDHDDLHNQYSDLLYDAMRKYNPKTRDELVEEYQLLESDLAEFNITINDLKQELWDMSDKDFSAAVLKSNEQSDKTKSSKQSANKDSQVLEEINQSELNQDSDNSQINTIDIAEFDQNENQEEQNVDSEFNSKNKGDEAIASTNQFISEFKAMTNELNSSDNINKHISLKEQNLKQLKQEKELTKQEFSHLEETQKLTQQGVAQLQQHLELKNQQIELEQLDNNKLLELNTNARDKTKEQLTIIEDKTVSLNDVVSDLENQNAEARLKLEEDKKTQSIEKQFEMLKSNKTQDLERLQDHLATRKIDLGKLQEQLKLLEEEIFEMEQDISSKQRGISDLEEKERFKNKERLEQFEEQESVIESRVVSINSKLKELDILSADAESTRNELNDFDQHIQSITKEFESIARNNDSELKDIEYQQEQKVNKLTETQNLKTSKTEEIDQINKRIELAENSLEELKSELSFTEKKNNVKPKIQLEKETV